MIARGNLYFYTAVLFITDHLFSFLSFILQGASYSERYPLRDNMYFPKIKRNILSGWLGSFNSSIIAL